jgi:AcrR family transcriptional regulator
MPTGTTLEDPRGLLFAAAERVLLRDGPAAVTSRAVTIEAHVAKGLLHRHFNSFDAFLAAFVLGYIARLEPIAATLRAHVGSVAVRKAVEDALAGALNPAARGAIALTLSRQDVLARLRTVTPTGVPVLAEMTKILASYFTAERGLGNIDSATDVDQLARLTVASAYVELLSDPTDRQTELSLALNTSRSAHELQARS